MVAILDNAGARVESARNSVSRLRFGIRRISVMLAKDGQLTLAAFGHPLPQAAQQAVDRVAIQTRERRNLHHREIGSHATKEAAETGLGLSGTHDMAVSHGKSAYPERSGKAQLVMTLGSLVLIALGLSSSGCQRVSQSPSNTGEICVAGQPETVAYRMYFTPGIMTPGLHELALVAKEASEQQSASRGSRSERRVLSFKKHAVTINGSRATVIEFAEHVKEKTGAGSVWLIGCDPVVLAWSDRKDLEPNRDSTDPLSSVRITGGLARSTLFVAGIEGDSAVSVRGFVRRSASTGELDWIELPGGSTLRDAMDSLCRP